MQAKFVTAVVLAISSCALQFSAIAGPPPVLDPLAPPPAPPPATPLAAPAVKPVPPAVAHPTANPANLADNVIAWDSTDKSVTVESGTPAGKFSFSLTNISAEPVTIVGVRTSCGCTTAQLPAMPWKIEPGANGEFNVNMNLAGKSGTVIKSVTVSTDKGTKNLLVRTTITPLQTSAGMPSGKREMNQRLAQQDRQMVFKGDCANCHAEPAKGKEGQALYAAVCGVCHEAEHRATMVPDLHVAKQERDREYWRNWITNGKQGSLMPAFAVAGGGILTDAQINSLVTYLVKAMPAKPAPTTSSASSHNSPLSVAH